MNGELALLSTYLWFFLAVAFLFLVLAPFLIWKNTANTTALLRYLLEEQERTNDLLALLIKERAATDTTATPAVSSSIAPDLAPDMDPAEDTVTQKKLAPDFTLEED